MGRFQPVAIGRKQPKGVSRVGDRRLQPIAKKPPRTIITLPISSSFDSRIDISINLDILNSWNYSKYSKPSPTLHALKS